MVRGHIILIAATKLILLRYIRNMFLKHSITVRGCIILIAATKLILLRYIRNMFLLGQHNLCFQITTQSIKSSLNSYICSFKSNGFIEFSCYVVENKTLLLVKVDLFKLL